MKQINLFGEDFEEVDNTYTKKIVAPLYEPKNRKPFPQELYDHTKALKMIAEINNSSVSEEEKKFLIEAARRHTVFNYSLIADYYAHSSKEMQELMENSALVIIDFNKALERGYVKLSEEMRSQF